MTIIKIKWNSSKIIVFLGNVIKNTSKCNFSEIMTFQRNVKLIRIKCFLSEILIFIGNVIKKST